jgi:hypothetical protein
MKWLFNKNFTKTNAISFSDSHSYDNSLDSSDHVIHDTDMLAILEVFFSHE